MFCPDFKPRTPCSPPPSPTRDNVDASYEGNGIIAILRLYCDVIVS